MVVHQKEALEKKLSSYFSFRLRANIFFNLRNV
jgi:hypothetical protein